MHEELSERWPGMKSQTPAAATSGGQRGRGKVVREPKAGTWHPHGNGQFTSSKCRQYRRACWVLSIPPFRRASSEFAKYGPVALWLRAWWGRAA